MAMFNDRDAQYPHDFRGRHSFRLRIVGFGQDVNYIYARHNQEFRITFRYQRSPNKQFIRAYTVFAEDPLVDVIVCRQHKQHHHEPIFCQSVLRSTLRSNSRSLNYHSEPRYAIVVKCPMNLTYVTLGFKFICMSSCPSGINRRPICIIFELIDEKKYPAWDVARPTPQVLMEQARRDLMEADEKLAQKREEEKKNREVMDEKWADLRSKELLLKESFISFNKFIRENQEKRDRAERKMEEDTEVLDRKTRETEAMRQRVDEMEEVKELMEKQVKDYTIYEDYLMSVVHNYPEFKQPLDVLNRYEALAAAKSTLAERQERDLEMLENARQEIAELTEEKKLFIMGLNNTLANLRWRYDKVRNRVIKWELALNRLKETAAKRHVELCHVRSAIWSLYVKICKHKGLAIDVKTSDFEQQLVVIMRALLELRRIYRIAQRRSKEKDMESNPVLKHI